MAIDRRTRIGTLVGFAILVVGVSGAAYLGTRDRGGTGAAPENKVQVLYAAAPVDAGVAGPSALASGQVRAKAVGAASRPSDALTDPSQLTGKVAATAIPEGTILTEAMFPSPQTRIGTVAIPPGKRALALNLDPVPGVAGFVGAGDFVDIYGISAGANGAPPGVKLVLQSVEVLNVNGTGLPTAQGQASGPNLVYLLAVTPVEAERLIYLTSFDKLYFDLVPKGEAPVTTPGATPGQALQVL